MLFISWTLCQVCLFEFIQGGGTKLIKLCKGRAQAIKVWEPLLQRIQFKMDVLYIRSLLSFLLGLYWSLILFCYCEMLNSVATLLAYLYDISTIYSWLAIGTGKETVFGFSKVSQWLLHCNHSIPALSLLLYLDFSDDSSEGYSEFSFTLERIKRYNLYNNSIQFTIIVNCIEVFRIFAIQLLLLSDWNFTELLIAFCIIPVFCSDTTTHLGANFKL
jgi:hypothetical protein